jgi:hypothetical protein
VEVWFYEGKPLLDATFDVSATVLNVTKYFNGSMSISLLGRRYGKVENIRLLDRHRSPSASANT